MYAIKNQTDASPILEMMLSFKLVSSVRCPNEHKQFKHSESRSEITMSGEELRSSGGLSGVEEWVYWLLHFLLISYDVCRYLIILYVQYVGSVKSS